MPGDWRTWAREVAIPLSAARRPEKRERQDRNARKVLAYLADIASDAGVATPLLTRLAGSCGLERSEAATALQQLGLSHIVIGGVQLPPQPRAARNPNQGRAAYYLDPPNNPAYQARIAQLTGEVRDAG